MDTLRRRVRHPLSLATLALAGLVLLSAAPVRAQVCPGDITLTSQAEVDAFACSQVTGNLTIAGSDIEDLAPLSGLASVGGGLVIEFNAALGSISGLSGLASLGENPFSVSLSVRFNDVLGSLAGLEGLTSVDGGLVIETNAALTSLAGLEGLTTIGGGLNLNDNNTLSSLAGLEGLTSVGGRLFIDNNAVLGSLAGLEGLTAVGGFVSISGNAALGSLVGLEGVTSLSEGLDISNNAALTSLTGLEGLTSVAERFFISGNAALGSLTGLSGLTDIGGSLFIEDNAVLTSLAGLESLASIGGGLFIQANAVLVSLAGLEGLTAIGVDTFGLSLFSLLIGDNAALESLAGLENVTSVFGSVFVENNDALASLAGLSGLTFVGLDLAIDNNAALASLEGLESLISVAGGLGIFTNDALVDCACGLAGLIFGDPPAFSGAGAVSIVDNAVGGRCTSPEVVLANPCETEEPTDDETPPVCAPITPEYNGPGGVLSAIATAASDPESGIASVRFTRLVNLNGYVDANGPFAQGDTYTTADSPPVGVALRAERIDYGMGGRIVVTVTNGVGLTATCDPIVSELAAAVPDVSALLGAYPNPFRLSSGAGAVRIPLRLAEASAVRVTVYDVGGRAVAVLVDGDLAAGSYEVAWPEASALPAGTYVVRMTAGSFVGTQRLTLVK